MTVRAMTIDDHAVGTVGDAGTPVASDLALIKAAQDGDTVALDRLLGRHGPSQAVA